MDFTGDEYNYYVNWVLHAILGMLREADSLMRSHGGSIRRMARKLRRELGVPTHTLWRGLLLEPGEVPPDRMVPPRPRAHGVKSVSWSEDKEVGCWFADRDNDMAMMVRMQRPTVTGWMMKVTPQKQNVLWHWSWQNRFPSPRGPGTISLEVLASMHPHIDVTQFHWALQTQKEVILVPLNRAVAVVPYGDAGCPPPEELNRRLGGPLRRRNPDGYSCADLAKMILTLSGIGSAEKIWGRGKFARAELEEMRWHISACDECYQLALPFASVTRPPFCWHLINLPMALYKLMEGSWDPANLDDKEQAFLVDVYPLDEAKETLEHAKSGKCEMCSSWLPYLLKSPLGSHSCKCPSLDLFRYGCKCGGKRRKRSLRRNPKLRIEDDLFVFAGDEPIREAWDEVADDNIMTVGPFPPIMHYPGTHILYLFEDPDSKELFRELFTNAQREECKRCLWRKTEEVPCCSSAEYEFTWYDDDGNYIGPKKYDPDEGWEEFPECECKCECLYPPIFQNRQPIGGIGTINMFWDIAASKHLVGAVQFVASDDDNDLMITHMAVKDPYRRNRINSFMIDQVVKKYPHRKLSFHDPTPLGRKFMESYGGEEWGATAD